MKPKRKLPYMPWFVAVWLTDQAVCGLSPTARGVWFDWLNHMWADEQRGILTGSKELLAKLGRCDVSVVDSVADELVSTRADQLRGGGNGVVPLQAAFAFVQLARRLGIA